MPLATTVRPRCPESLPVQHQWQIDRRVWMSHCLHIRLASILNCYIGDPFSTTTCSRCPDNSDCEGQDMEYGCFVANSRKPFRWDAERELLSYAVSVGNLELESYSDAGT